MAYRRHGLLRQAVLLPPPPHVWYTSPASHHLEELPHHPPGGSGRVSTPSGVGGAVHYQYGGVCPDTSHAVILTMWLVIGPRTRTTWNFQLGHYIPTLASITTETISFDLKHYSSSVTKFKPGFCQSQAW